MSLRYVLMWSLVICLTPHGFLTEAKAQWQASPEQVESLLKQRPEYTYRETDVPAYTLPNPLLTSQGTPVTSAKAWTEQRRAEVLELFKTHVYGRAPLSLPKAIRFEVTDKSALNGQAIRKQVRMIFSDKPGAPSPEILIYLPAAASKPVPLFLALNFRGNHTIWPDSDIHLPQTLRNPGESLAAYRERLASSRGSVSRFPVTTILSRGYGLATIFYKDLEPDDHKITDQGLRHTFATSKESEAWGAIGAWSWGLSKALDYFEADAHIDHKRVAVLGHSRLGKTSLWAGAQDPRFAMIVSNDSGCGGAALSRRHYGETVKRINTSFPHWFCDRFKEYNDNEAALPLDQHMLIALQAPRPVCVGSASEDLWADPRGEFLACQKAEPVYALLGVTGLGAATMPDLEQPVQAGTISYHIRSGKHDLTEYDWQRYMDFADMHLTH